MLAMLREGVYSCMFELLFRYKANSLLHQFVVMATDCLLRRGDFSIRKYLFFDFSLVSRLLDIWDEDGKNVRRTALDSPAVVVYFHGIFVIFVAIVIFAVVVVEWRAEIFLLLYLKVDC